MVIRTLSLNYIDSLCLLTLVSTRKYTSTSLNINYLISTTAPSHHHQYVVRLFLVRGQPQLSACLRLYRTCSPQLALCVLHYNYNTVRVTSPTVCDTITALAALSITVCGVVRGVVIVRGVVCGVERGTCSSFSLICTRAAQMSYWVVTRRWQDQFLELAAARSSRLAEQYITSGWGGPTECPVHSAQHPQRLVQFTIMDRSQSAQPPSTALSGGILCCRFLLYKLLAIFI